ncbi:MAG: hypothetical protein Q4P16_11595 [Spirochaetales bacterium]|nr:hypothetical protein [Spirochaetales bacterium]
MIFSMIMAFISVLDVFLLQAPLLTFSYYGFFSESNTTIFAANIIGKIIKLDVITMTIMIFQVFMTLAFVIVLFLFIKKIVFLFLKDEKLVRGYYWSFFVATLLVPVLLIFFSIFFKGKIWIVLSLIIELAFFLLNTILLIFTKKILPETTDAEYRKYLFENGAGHE